MLRLRCGLELLLVFLWEDILLTGIHVAQTQNKLWKKTTTFQTPDAGECFVCLSLQVWQETIVHCWLRDDDDSGCGVSLLPGLLSLLVPEMCHGVLYDVQRRWCVDCK